MNKMIVFLFLMQLSLVSVAKSNGVTGTYKLKWSKDAGCVLKAQQTKQDKLQFELNCDEGFGGNSGLAFGVLDFKDNVAVFTRNVSGLCEITFKFQNNSVEVTQNGMDVYCGFGMGIHASGNYRLDNNRNPNFKY